MIIGVLAYTYSLGDMSGRKNAESQGYAANYPEDTAKRIDKCYRSSEPAGVQKCIEESIKADRENQRGEQDLEAQRNMADWAFWFLVFTIIQIPFATAGLVALIVTIRQGLEANKIALEAERAWLDFDIEMDGILVDYGGDGYDFRIIISVRNIGSNPATDVREHIVGIFFDDIPEGEHPFDSSGRDKLLAMNCKTASDELKIMPIEGPTIFPKGTHQIFCESGVPWDFDRGFPRSPCWLTVGLRYCFPGGEGETIKTYCVRSFGLPNPDGFDYVGKDGGAFTETDAVIKIWHTASQAN